MPGNFGWGASPYGSEPYGSPTKPVVESEPEQDIPPFDEVVKPPDPHPCPHWDLFREK